MGPPQGPPLSPLPPPAPGYGPVPPPAGSPFIVPGDGRRVARGRRGRKVLGFVLVLALAAGGGYGFVYWQRNHKKVTNTASSDPVGALILRSVPAGYNQQADPVGDTGPSDLAKAVKDDGGSDAQSALTHDGFVHGYQRLWSTADAKNSLVAFLYQFSSPAGAKAYAAREVTSLTSGSPTPTRFSVSGIPGAVGLQGPDGDGGNVAAITFTRGSYTAQVEVDAPSASGLAKLAQQEALAQYNQLPGR